MSNNCKEHKVPCGCKDTGIVTPPPCGDGIECPDSNQCSETFDGDCIFYTGNPILCGEDEVVPTNIPVSEALTLITDYFCDSAEHALPQDLMCADDVVAAQGSTIDDTFSAIVTYFCTYLSDNLLTTTSVAAADAVDIDGCITRNWTITFLAGVTEITNLQFSTPPICPPLDLCAQPTVPTPNTDDEFIMCRTQLGLSANIRKLTFQSILDAVLNALPGNILSAYNSQTGVGNTAGASTVNAITVSIPGNTLANDGDEYEMDLYTEYQENDPVTMEIGIGAGATWSKVIQNASDDKRFFKIKVARIDQNNQLWTISSLIDTFPNIENLEDVDVIYTTKDLSTTENWTVKLINDGSAGANAIVLHKAVLYLNKV